MFSICSVGFSSQVRAVICATCVDANIVTAAMSFPWSRVGHHDWESKRDVVEVEAASTGPRRHQTYLVAFLGKRNRPIKGFSTPNFKVPEDLRFLHPNSTHLMDTDGRLVAQAVQFRRYMSKSQRACDFCRERKSACRIEGGAPCQLCTFYSRQCTFKSGSSARKRRAIDNTDSGVTLAPPIRPSSVESVTDLSAANQPETLSSRILETESFEHTAQPNNTEMFLNSNDGIPAEESPSELQAIVPPSGDVFDPFGDWFASPNLLMNGNEEFEMSPQLAIQDGRYCVLTGDMDPYLLRLYRFNEHSVFPFKKLTVRSIDSGHLPIQFLQTIKDESEVTSPIPDTDDVSRSELNTIVPHVVGVQLISL